MNTPSRLHFLLLTALLFLFASAVSYGSTLRVPSQYRTIQAGINAAQTGDTVLVADSTYRGTGNCDLDFLGKSLTVKSEHGPASTIIDCEGSEANQHRAFYVHRRESSVMIDGFTVEHGYTSGDGGGANVSGGQVSVTNCIFKGNTVAGNGNTSGNGGGISIGISDRVALTNCVFNGNTVYDKANSAGLFKFGEGGGAYISSPDSVVSKCSFNKNTARYGGGLEFFVAARTGGAATATNCSFSDNTANYEGGGAFCYGGYANGQLVVTNCSFSDNTANGQNGGALGCITDSLTVTNCIGWGDKVPNSSLSSEFSFYSYLGTQPTVTYSDIQGGHTGIGNINADPLFANIFMNDYRLKPRSPCLGVGTSTGAPTTDLDGTPRPNPPSMGAYEKIPAPPRYTTIDLGALPGDSVSFPHHLNNNGAVVGHSAVRTGYNVGPPHGFLWQNGTMTPLGVLPGGTYTYPTSINDSGHVTGWGDNAPFLYMDGQLQPLPGFGGNFLSNAYAINNLDQIVGASISNATLGYPVAALWTNGMPQNIDTRGGYYSIAYDINDSGQVVGYVAVQDPYSPLNGAFLWTAGTGMQSLPIPVSNGWNYDSARTQAFAINDKGLIVGSVIAYAQNVYEGHPCLWADGFAQDLRLDGLANANAINSTGQIVGNMIIWGDYSYYSRASLYINGTTYNLDDLLVQGSLGLTNATGINDRGQICAVGGDHAYLLTPVGTEVTENDSKLHFRATDGGSEREVDGIVCDNLSGMDDSLKDKLELKVTDDFPTATGLTGEVSASGSNTNDTGEVRTLPDGKTYYFPPLEFNENQLPQNASADITKPATRNISLTLHFSTSDGVRHIIQKTLTLARPPVVLVHGINSGPDRWSPFLEAVNTGHTPESSTDDIHIPFVTVNHQSTQNGNGPVESAAALLSNRIADVLNQMRESTPANPRPITDPIAGEFRDYVPYRFAVKRVDIVAWSYGGVIARWYINAGSPNADQSPAWYQRTPNYGVPIAPTPAYRGDIRKLFTLGSMWRGVPLANYLNEALGETFTSTQGNVGFGNAPVSIASSTLGPLARSLPIKTSVPSMEVMAVDSPWMRQLIYQSQTPQVTAMPFSAHIAYGSVAGDDNRYPIDILSLNVHRFDFYSTLDFYQNPSWFPYLPLERASNTVHNYSDGLVPLWSASIPGSTKIAPTNHHDFPSNPDTQEYLIQWLNNANLPSGESLNIIWNDPIRSKVSDANPNKTWWSFSPGQLAPYPQSDFYQQQGGVGRLNSQAFGSRTPIARPNAVLTKEGRDLVLNVTVANVGFVLIPDLQITTVSLVPSPGSTAIPSPDVFPLGTVFVGASQSVSIRFRNVDATLGQVYNLRMNYTYTLSRGVVPYTSRLRVQ